MIPTYTYLVHRGRLVVTSHWPLGTNIEVDGSLQQDIGPIVALFDLMVSA